tara:strand:+ start:443 stop:706 length:264 start_codon:yes stop_codon:yes gene_type:complete
MNKKLKFDCGELQNDGFSCSIVALDTQWYYTELIPFQSKDDEGNISEGIDYGHCEFIDGEITGYYCNTCNVEFTYDEVIAMIKEEEE